MLSETEARTKWCPMALPRPTLPEPGSLYTQEQVARFKSAMNDKSCIASACMAWRWQTMEGYYNQRSQTERGYCGAFGEQK